MAENRFEIDFFSVCKNVDFEQREKQFGDSLIIERSIICIP